MPAKGPAGKGSAAKGGAGPPGRKPARREREAPGLSARLLALEVLEAVLDGARLEEVLEARGKSLAAFDPRDRAFLRALVAATLRRLGQIDDALSRFLERPLPDKARHVRRILQLGAAQILFLSVPAHAAVDLSVRLAKANPDSARFSALVNGVLRRLAARADDILASQDEAALNIPGWLMRRWSATYGEANAHAIAASLLVEPTLDLTVKSDPQGWATRLGGTVLPQGSVRLVPEGPVEALQGFGEGAWWVQDAAAALPARLLGDVAGKSVADLCAAPGGKTAQLALAGARVTAIDRSMARLSRLAANLTRLGLEAERVAADIMEWRPDRLFDAILLDAPCTATGTARRHPDVLHHRRPEDLAELAGIQAALLARALDLVRPGGHLVYCTCSNEPEEGEGQIARLLADGAPVRRLPVRAGEIGGLAACVTSEGDLRTLPSHLPGESERMSGMDGFYAARLERL